MSIGIRKPKKRVNKKKKASPRKQLSWEELFKRDKIVLEVSKLLECKPDKALKKLQKLIDEANMLKAELQRLQYQEQHGFPVRICKMCHGSGQMRVENTLRVRQWGTHIRCSRCDGEGYIPKE